MNAGIFLCTAGGEKRLHEKDKTPTIQRLLSNQQDMEALSSIQSMTCTKHIHDSTHNTKLIDNYLRWKARPWPWTSLLRWVSRMSWRVSGVVARVPWVPLLSWIAGVAGVAPAIRGSWGALQHNVNEMGLFVDMRTKLGLDITTISGTACSTLMRG